ncbi:MAG: regulator of CtrA degradation rcdA [Robiginitomaculum sp.]|nr:MAG: regulator of CtrA degradation rcdA [Robiginitomaculum sp.]
MSDDLFATHLGDFAGSELFQRTFREGMDLVEETAAYLDGPGREESRALSRSGALAYAGESMRLTTRLMQVASWLLVQRAVRESEMSATDARADKYRINDVKLSKSLAGTQELPAALQDLISRAGRIYERTRRLDEKLYGDNHENTGAQAVTDQLNRLNAAFGGRA